MNKILQDDRMTDKQIKASSMTGPGRKSLSMSGASPVLQVRLSPEQKAKVTALGGAQWVRKMIDKAKLGG